MLTIEFNEQEEKILKAYIELRKKLHDENSNWTIQNDRHYQIMGNHIARMTAKKLENTPWE